MYKPALLLRALFLLAILISFSSNAVADSNSDLIDALVKKGILTAEEAKPLLERVAAEAKQREEKQPAKKTASVDVGDSGIVVKSADGDFSMTVGGRIHADVFSHSGDDNLAGDVEAVDGTEIRRSRIYLSGKANSDFKYKIEADFAGNRVGMRDVYLTYTGFNSPLELTVGNQKHAVSMEIEESSNDIMFTERSLLTALTTPFFDRVIGATLKAKGDNWHVKGGIFGDSISSGSSNVDEGNGFGIRGTYTPILEKDRVLHLGASYGSRSSGEDNDLNTRSAALSHETTSASSLRLFNTGTIADVDNIETAIFELAGIYGPLSFQSEIATTTVERDTGGDLDFDGFYAQVGYSLTGETRSYKGSEGEFKILKPANSFDLSEGTWGAWEVAARYDTLNLNDGGVFGGDGERLTLALNWYLNRNFRILANYSKVFDISEGPIVQNDGSEADDIDVVTIRTQWAF